MLLAFDRDATAEPIRPIEVAAVLTALEEIFLATLLRDAPPRDHRGRDWAWDYDAQSVHIQLAGVELGREPRGRLRVLVAIPWHVYTVPFSAFAYGIAHVFGAPAQEESLFERARARTSGAPAWPLSSPSPSGWSGRHGSRSSTSRSQRSPRT